MKTLILAVAVSALVAGSVSAAPDYRSQPGYRQGPSAHPGWGQNYRGGHKWRSGERIGYDDWADAAPVNYRRHHLRQPPRGYEWRESNGQYVLAAVATGLIASIILNSNHR
jgi:hypothetical protein